MASILPYQRYDQRKRDWRGSSSWDRFACLWAVNVVLGDLKGGVRKKRRARDIVHSTAQQATALSNKSWCDGQLSFKLIRPRLVLAAWHEYAPRRHSTDNPDPM